MRHVEGAGAASRERPALEPLILLLQSDDIEILREVCAALCNLSTSEETKYEIAKSGAVPPLIAHAQSEDMDLARQSCATLANLTEVEENQEKICLDGGVQPLIAMMRSQFVEVQREAGRALGNLSAIQRNHDEITWYPSESGLLGFTLLRSNALRYISAFTQDEDTMTQRFGTLAIGNIAVDPKTHKDLFDQGAVTVLMTIDKSTDLETRRSLAFALSNLAANEANSSMIAKLGVLRTVIALLHDDDEDTHLQACFALRRMAIEAKNRTQAVSFGALKLLFKLAASESVEVQREVCTALRNLSLSEDNKVVIVLNGGLVPLISLVHSDDNEVAHQACGVLANLTKVVENQGRMVKDGVLQHIKFVLRSKSVDVQREALRAIANMSAEYAYTSEIVSGGGLTPLMTALSSPDFLSQRYAAMGIANLSTHANNITKIIQDGIVPILVALGENLNGDLDTQRYAIYTLTNMGSVRATQPQLIDASVLPLFTELIRHADVTLRNAAAFGVANFAAFPENHMPIMVTDALCLESLLYMVSSQDHKCQYRAVSALRGLCVNEVARKEIVRCGRLPALLKLTKSEDMDVQQEVLACLCNLSLSGCIGAHPDVFIEACDMSSLVSFLCSADATYRLFGAVTLGSIASKVEHQDALVGARAVTPLVEIANSVDLETHRCIAFALCNLAANPERRQLVEELGGIVPIIQLACSDNVDDQKTAIAVLRGISNRPESRLRIVSEGGMEPLLLGARSRDAGLQRELDIAKSPMMGALINLMLSADVITAKFACVANLAENFDTHFSIERERGLHFFLEFQKQATVAPDVAREAVKCVTNLSSDSALHDALLADCCHEFLVHAIQHADVPTRLFGAIGLCNLVANPQNHSRVLREQVAEPLIRLISDTTHADPRRFAILAVGSIFANLKNHSTFIDQDVLPPLIAALEPLDDMETRFNAAFAIGKLAMNDAYHALIGEQSNFGAPLIQLAIDADVAAHTSAQYQAISGLRRLTCLDTNRMDMMHRGQQQLLEALLRCATQPELESQHEVVACICNLTLAQANKIVVAQSSKLFHQLVTLCMSTDIEVARNAYGAVANIPEDVETHMYMIDVHAVHVGVKTMRRRHLPVYREATRMISNLLSTPEFHMMLLHEEGLSALMRVAKIEDHECQYNTALSFHKLSSNTVTHAALLTSGAVETLHALLTVPGLDVQHQAAASLKNLTASKENKPKLADDGTVLAMVSLLRSPDVTLKCMGAAGLRHLTLHTPIEAQVVHEGGLPPLFSCCALEDDNVRVQCSGMLANLSENVINQMEIVKQNGVAALVALAKASYDPEIAQNTSRSFANLSSNAENHLGVFHVNELRAVFTLGMSKEENCGRDAATCIGNLAVTSKNQFQITECGGLIPLTQLLQSQFASNRQYAARAMYRLSAHAENQPRIVDAGALVPLIKLLSEVSDDVETRRCAAMTICNLSTNIANEQKIMKAGGMRPLVMLLRSTSVEVAKYACMALCNLTANPANQLHLVKDEGLDPLVDLASSPDPECAYNASMVLSNVTAHRQNRLVVVERHALRPLRALSFAPNLECQHSAALAIYNVSCAQANQFKIVEAGIETALIKLAGSNDGDCKLYATMTLCNLAANVETRQAAARGGGLQALIVCSKDVDVSPSARAWWSAPIVAMTEKDDDLESQRFGIMALSNLAVNEANHEHMISRGVLKVALRLGMSKDEDIRQYAAFALANFSGNADHCAVIGEEGGVLTLITLAHSEDTNSHTLAISALRRLCQFSAQNRGRIVRGGGLVPLTIAGHSEELEAQREVAATFCNLSLSDEYKVEIVNQGALRLLIKLVQSPDLEVARQACGALANLAEHIDTHETFAQERCGSFLIGLMKHRNLEIHREASRTMANLLSSFKHHTEMITDGLTGLVHLGLSLDTECQYNAALAFRKLAPNFASHRGIIYEGGLKMLFFLLQVKEVNIRRQAILALQDITANNEHKRKYVEEGGLRALITFLRDADIPLQAPTLAAFRHLSLSHAKIKQQIVECGALRPLLRCMNNSNTKNLDLQCQCTGLVANLSEYLANQTKIADEVLTSALVTLAFSVDSAEIHQDVSCALANLCSNEENHIIVYKQGGLKCLVHLTNAKDDVTQRYAAMGLRFLSSNPQICVFIVQESLLPPFIKLAQSSILDYQRTAASVFSSFSLNEENKLKLVRDGGYTRILKCCLYDDLEVKRDCVFALANIADSLEYRFDVVREGAITVLVDAGAQDDARVQRDCARALASLSITNSIKPELIKQHVLKPLFRLTRSLDSATQRFATLAICNLAAGDDKIYMVDQGTIRPLTHLIRFPDAEIQRYAALALAGLALGDHGNKIRMIEDGAVHPLVDLLRYPSVDVQLCGCLALNALVLGKLTVTKVSMMQEGDLLPLLALLSSEDMECVRCALYCLGSLAESKDVLLKLVELGAMPQVIAQSYRSDSEIKRNCGYVFDLIEQQTDYHDDFVREGGMDAAIALACVEDMECQEYATFALAHLASNREYQVPLVEHGALRPLIAMMSVHAEPRHYAGLALLKLADNYENHLRIAEEGGIQALLRIARARSTDEELQYKASLSLGQLASNATKSLPNQGKVLGSASDAIGAGVAKMAQITESIAARRAREKMTQYLDDKIVREKNNAPVVLFEHTDEHFWHHARRKEAQRPPDEEFSCRGAMRIVLDSYTAFECNTFDMAALQAVGSTNRSTFCCACVHHLSLFGRKDTHERKADPNFLRSAHSVALSLHSADHLTCTTMSQLHASLHHPAQRDWSEPHFHPSQLIYPLFVTARAEDREIKGLEPNKQWGQQADGSFSTLVAHLKHLQTLGLRSVMLFGVVEDKDAHGSLADDPNTPVIKCTAVIRKQVPELLVSCDVCMCEYTSHGHCGLLRSVDGEDVIENASTVDRLARIALAYARAGAHMVCPSDMMDNRIHGIRTLLNAEGFQHVSIMAYTSKKASCMYAPFRDAVESTFTGDRKRYQHPVGSTSHAALAFERDLREGADIVIVKPSLFYADIVKSFADKKTLPVACYIVSGEYKMLFDYGSATNTLESVVKESHVSLLRAGSSVLITYFTPYILERWTKWVFIFIEATMEQAIVAKGNEIRELKAAKGDAEQIKQLVAELLALKEQYKVETGTEYVAPKAEKAPKKAVAAPAPEGGEGKSKNQLKKEKKLAEAAAKKAGGAAAGGKKKAEPKKKAAKPSESAKPEEGAAVPSDADLLLRQVEFNQKVAALGDSDGQVVTPWDVEAENGVDYDKLIKTFGCSKIDQSLIDRMEKLTGHKAHRYLRRGYFFSHRDLSVLLDSYEKGEKFFLYTGRGPSSGSLHMGHLIPFTFTAWLQKVFDVPLVIQLTDDEKFLFKEQTLEESRHMMWENAKDIIACGFDAKKTFIFANTEYIQVMYPQILKVQKCVTYNQVRGIFGFTGSDNIGKSAFPAVQAVPSFSETFPVVLGGRKGMRCLIPQAIDQDPYFRMTRDVAPRIGYLKPALIHSKFFPALQGSTTKMSASKASTTIYISDSPEEIANKIKKYAFSGGGETKADHEKYGANLEVDIPYQYLSFMLEDDEKLNHVAQEYGSGRMMSGEVKQLLIDVMSEFAVDMQQRRAAVTDDEVKEFMRARSTASEFARNVVITSSLRSLPNSTGTSRSDGFDERNTRY
ncbi:Vacuolar protein, partial [Globisporangium splendens]